MALLMASVVLGGCATVEHGYDSALLLGDVQAGADASRLKERTEAPERDVIDYARRGRPHVADVYQPQGRPSRGTLVLIHGFTPYGRRDPRLMAFARSMARSGFTVVVPDVVGPMTGSVSLDDSRAIRDTLAYVADGAGGYARGPIGVMAYSFAVGPAVIAANHPSVARHLDFLVGVGGYYDLPDAITYMTTGVDPGGPADTLSAPRRRARWVFLQSQLPRLSHDEDRALLRRIAERRLGQNGTAVGDLVAELSPAGHAVYALVSNHDPGRVDTLIAALPERVRAQIRGLDLARRDLDRLTADVVLIHGRDDDVIPISHSERLREALGPDQARLYRASGLKHVDVAPGIVDSFALWQAAIHIFELAERHDEPVDNGARGD